MEIEFGGICCTGGQSYSDRQRARDVLSPKTHRLAFDFLGDSSGRQAQTGQFALWPDSRSSARWYSLANTARLPLGATNHVRRFLPFVLGQW